MVEKAQLKLAPWKGKLLNKVGHLCLTNYVLASMLINSMQTMLFPKSICTKVDQCCRLMIWSAWGATRCWNLASWQGITQPKLLGGL